MTLEKTPPLGKIWVTVEVDQEDYDSVSSVDLWDLDHVKEERGEIPDNRSTHEKITKASESLRAAHAQIGPGTEELHTALLDMAIAFEAIREDL